MTLGFFYKKTGRNDDIVANVRQGEKFKPSFGDAVSSGLEAGYSGEGSATEDLLASRVNRELGRDQTFMQSLAGSLDFEDIQSSPISKEEYEKSQYYREGLSYEEGMTDVAASIRANRFDLQQKQGFILQQSNWLGKGAFFVSSIAGGLGDAKNLSVGLATSAAFSVVGPVGAGVGGFAGTLTSAIRTGGKAALSSGRALRQASSAAAIATRNRAVTGMVTSLSASRVAGEAAVSTLPSVISGVQNQAALGSDYGVGDAFIDLGASIVLSVGLNSAARKLWGTTAKPQDQQALATLMASQAANAEKIDVEPMIQGIVAETVSPLSTINLDVEKPRVTPKSGGVFEAQFPDDGGLMAGVKATGNSVDEAVSNLRSLYLENLGEAADQLGLTPEQLRTIRDVQELRDKASNFDTRQREIEIAREQGLTAEADTLEASYKNVEAARADLNEKNEALRKNPRAANRQADQANAQSRLERAEQELDQLRAEVLGDIPTRVRAEAEDAKRVANDAFNSVRTAQREQAAVRMKEFVREQIDPTSSKSRSADALVREFDETATARAAREAPPPGSQGTPASPARQEIRELLQSEDVPAESKRLLEEFVKFESEIPQRRVQALQAFKSCIKG